jgi:transcriptional antiterminator RfaH
LEVFHPRLKIERATQRGVVNIVEPLFPCYIFVRCFLSDSADAIRFTHGISSLVHFGIAIPAVPQQVIDELRQCFESEEPMLAQDPMRVGSEVIVAEGSFLGSRGIVVRMLPAKKRVQILLDFLGRTTLTEVDRKSLTLEDQSLADMMPVLATATAA